MWQSQPSKSETRCDRLTILLQSNGRHMILREEIRQFLVVSQTLLDGGVNTDDLTDIEVDLIQYYLFEIAHKFSRYSRP